MGGGSGFRGATLLVVLTVLAYLPALRCGFIWDDDFYVTANPALRSGAGLRRIWTEPGWQLRQYYPLAFTGLWAEYHLWGLHPLGYHLVNVLLHALNAVLLWRVLRRLDPAPAAFGAGPGAWCAAAIFALHPVQVESVAWITEFKNVSSATFSLLAVLAFLRSRPLSASGTAALRDWRFDVLGFLLFVCGLLCKTAVCCLPVALAALLWWKLDRIEKRDVLALIPWFVASLTLGLVTVAVETHSAETSTTQGALSILQRGLLSGRALCFYAGKVFWPHPLTFIYPRWKVDTSVPWQYWFPVGALVVVAGLWLLRRRLGKGPVTGVACFAVMLLPVLGFSDIYFFRYSYVTDHFQYLACSGLIAVAVGAGTTLVDRAGPRGRQWGTLGAGVVLVVLGVSTWRQTHTYKDLETLWRDTLAKNPNAWIAHTNLGVVLADQGKVTEAITEYKAALSIDPNSPEAHFNFGNALLHEGDLHSAVQQWEETVRINPDHADAQHNLGRALLGFGKPWEAAEHCQEALRLNPDDAEAHNYLGNALLALGKTQEAIEQWEQAVRFRPDYADAHNNLGVAFAQAGRLQQAIEQFDLVLLATPGDPVVHYNLGLALEQSGKIQDAIVNYERALSLKPDYPAARNRLASLRARLVSPPAAGP